MVFLISTAVSKHLWSYSHTKSKIVQVAVLNSSLCRRTWWKKFSLWGCGGGSLDAQIIVFSNWEGSTSSSNPESRSLCVCVCVRYSLRDWFEGSKHHCPREIFLYLGCEARLIVIYLLMFRDNVSVPSSKGNPSLTFWPLNMGQIGCPETSATNYQWTLRNIPEELRSYLYLGGSFKSRILLSSCRETLTQ